MPVNRSSNSEACRCTAHESYLTPAEERVAHLVAAGLTNRQIAEQMAITPRTVAFHVSNILRKLHLNNRAQIAAWWHRRSQEG